MYTRKESYETAWLKAERELATCVSVTPSSTDDIPNADIDDLGHTEPGTTPKDLENYCPGVSRNEVFNALKKVAGASKSRAKCG